MTKERTLENSHVMVATTYKFRGNTWIQPFATQDEADAWLRQQDPPSSSKIYTLMRWDDDQRWWFPAEKYDEDYWCSAELGEQRLDDLWKED